MRSVRLDKHLDERVRQAAAAENVSVSEFLRRAVAERADRMLSGQPSERMADFIGQVQGDGTDSASRASEIWGDSVVERHRRRGLELP